MLSKINELVKNKTEQNDENINKQRIEWGEYFMSIAVLASQRRPCKRLNVGSVIVKITA